MIDFVVHRMRTGFWLMSADTVAVVDHCLLEQTHAMLFYLDVNVAQTAHLNFN